MRATEAVIDLGAIKRNTTRLITAAGDAQVCVVVKADAYSHGSVPVAQAVVEAGATWLAVALVEEGAALRRAGLDVPILVLSEPRPDEMFEVVEHGLTPSVYTDVGIAAIGAAAGFAASAEPVDVHLKINTGMNRVGLDPTALPGTTADPVREAIAQIVSRPELRLGGIWTHFAVADEPEHRATGDQLELFTSVLDRCRDLVPSTSICHASNSAGLLAHATARFDMVRPGIAVYGVAPSAQVPASADLEPVLELKTSVTFVKPVAAGASVSYGLRHRFDAPSTVATIAIGYADGLRRDAARHGVEVLIRGSRRPLIGAITMDQAMVDLGVDTSAQVGDEVVLIGAQGGEHITATEVADRLGTIPYEVLCAIGPRVVRRYV